MGMVLVGATLELFVVAWPFVEHIYVGVDGMVLCYLNRLREFGPALGWKLGLLGYTLEQEGGLHTVQRYHSFFISGVLCE
jgi:hypothetical protein